MVSKRSGWFCSLKMVSETSHVFIFFQMIFSPQSRILGIPLDQLKRYQILYRHSHFLKLFIWLDVKKRKKMGSGGPMMKWLLRDLHAIKVF